MIQTHCMTMYIPVLVIISFVSLFDINFICCYVNENVDNSRKEFPYDSDTDLTEDDFYGLIQSALAFSEDKFKYKPNLKASNKIDDVEKYFDDQELILKTIEKHAFIVEETKKQLVLRTGVNFDDLRRSKMFVKAFVDVMKDHYLHDYIECDVELKYRTIDGSCNNLQHPTWGQAFTSKPRILPPTYRDGISLQRNTSISGGELPGARVISNILMKSESDPVLVDGLTLMVMAWGQFLTHDMMLSPGITDENNFGIDCCDPSVKSEHCFIIAIPDSDERFTYTRCLNFTRATPGPYTATSVLRGREQINGQTSFIDASNVYGATKDRSDQLRTFENASSDETKVKSTNYSDAVGLLRVSPGNLPPKDKNIHSCLTHKKENYCLRAGDDRINVQPHLQGLHTLFLREHNRIAKKLGSLNLHWDDEKLFQESRQIIGALYQRITYAEYLPTILRADYLEKYQLREQAEDVYDETINPGIRNEFSAAAFRFGHSQVPRIMATMFSNFSYHKVYSVKGSFGNPAIMEDHFGKQVPDFFRWLSTDILFKTDRMFEAGIRDYLFFQEGRSDDLAASNIQRGRDHALPVYNVWRRFCGLSEIKHFNVSKNGLIDHSKETSALLSSLYRHVEDIDLYVGGVSEENIKGGLVGPTFACIIAKQFRYLKFGDRFWYERHKDSAVFTADQLAEIKKVTMSSIICNNMKIGQIQAGVFHSASQKNQLKPCRDILSMDLTKWKEY